MIEILNQFGFNPYLFFGQIVNFLILAFIFKKFLYKPILKTLNERKKKITKGLRDAEEAAKALADADSEKEVILVKASKEAEKILEETKKSAEEMRDEILTGARTDADKIIKSAKAQVDAQMDEMEKRAKKASLDNSVAILEKVLDGLFTKDEKRKIMEKNMKVLSEHNKDTKKS